jgi:hypothetical protein
MSELVVLVRGGLYSAALGRCLCRGVSDVLVPEAARRWLETAPACVGANLTDRVINFLSQNCIQADIQRPSPLPHMNLNVSERLIWSLRGLARLTDRDRLKKQNS